MALAFFGSYFRIASQDIVYVPVSRKLLNSSFSQDVGAFVVVTNCERAGDLNMHMWKLIPVSISLQARMPQIEKVHASS